MNAESVHSASKKPKFHKTPVEDSIAKDEASIVPDVPDNLDQVDSVLASGSLKPETPDSKTAVEVAASDVALQTALDKVAELTNDLQRTRADFENFRKQVELQKSQAMSAARFATVEKFLPLLDDFARAIASYPDQLSPLAKNLAKLEKSLSIEPLDTKPGTPFNPDLHEAVSVLDGDGEIEVIAETLRPGYLYEGSVLRPAMVKVGYK